MPEREAQPSRPPLPSKPGGAKMPAYFQLFTPTDMLHLIC
jgi:hypothetical protein